MWGWCSSKRASGIDIAQRPGDHGPQFLQILLLSSLKGVNLVRLLEISGDTNLFPPMTNQNHLQNTSACLQYPKLRARADHLSENPWRSGDSGPQR